MTNRNIWKYYNDYRVIEGDLIKILQFIDYSDNNFKTNGAQIRKQIVTACSFIENITPECKRLLTDISSKEPNEKRPRESIPKYLNRISNETQRNISVIGGILQGSPKYPWLSRDVDSEGYRWWKAHNKCKHEEDKIENAFECAIDSTVAAFSCLVLLTLNQPILNFWHESDPIKIIIHPNERRIDYRNSSLNSAIDEASKTIK